MIEDEINADYEVMGSCFGFSTPEAQVRLAYSFCGAAEALLFADPDNDAGLLILVKEAEAMLVKALANVRNARATLEA